MHDSCPHAERPGHFPLDPGGAFVHDRELQGGIEHRERRSVPPFHFLLLLAGIPDAVPVVIGPSISNEPGLPLAFTGVGIPIDELLAQSAR
jgi:hypothetical protein